MKTDVKPITFRLRPEGKSLYCLVNVWPDKAAMQAHFRRIMSQEEAAGYRKSAATCTGYTEYRRGRKTGCFAEIDCHLGCIYPEIVAHETTHAVLRWARRVGLDPTRQGNGVDVSESEERFAEALGQMVAQFSNALHKHKVW